MHGSRQDMPQLLYRYSIPFESDPATNSIIAVSYATKMHWQCPSHDPIHVVFFACNLFEYENDKKDMM